MTRRLCCATATLRRPLEKTMTRRLCCATATLLAIALIGAHSAAAAPVSLGTAGTFAVLGGSTVTNTGPSVLNGDLGVSPGTALVGFNSPAVVNGATHANDAVAQGAQNDLTTAYNVAAGQPVTSDLTGQDLGGKSLMAGNYRYASSAQLTGQVTLDAAGDPNAQFVFMIGSTLKTASASSVRLINGASPCNVFWQVGSSATLGTTTAFAGNILALTSSTLDNGATVQGRVLARNGAVRLDTNNITRPACAAQVDGGTTGGGDGDGTGGGTTGGDGTGGDGTTGGGDGDGTGIAEGNGTITPSGGPPRIAGPRLCVKAPFWARVRGASIASVTFSVDGKRRSRVLAKPGRTVFVLLIKPMQQTGTFHRVTARVRFNAASARRPKTLRLAYQRCANASAAVTPQFTG